MSSHSIPHPPDNRVTLDILEQAQPYRPRTSSADFTDDKYAVLEALLIDSLNGGSGVSTPDLRARGGGERPPNRVKDLRDEDHHLIETIPGRPFRFKLLHVNLSAVPEKLLPLARQFEGRDWYVATTGKSRPAQHPWKNAFSEKRLAESDCFQLTPPEARS